MEFETIVILTIITGIILAIYYWSTATFNHWKDLGVPGPKPIPLIGNMGPLFFGRMAFVEIQHKLYEAWKKEPYFGIFNAREPVLMVNDPDLIRQILIKDFNVFPSRGVALNDHDPLSQNLFNIEGHRWKTLRGKLTSAFTTIKLKYMIELMVECANNFEKHLLKEIGEGKVLECRSLAAKYSLNVIGLCVFGANLNAIDQENNQFQVVAGQLFKPSFFNLIKQMISIAAPRLYKFMGLSILSEEQSTFFINFIKETMELRQREGSIRNDVIDILIDIKKNQHEFDFELTDSFLASQAFVFFVAGYEAAAATISFALYEMALVPEIQEKLRTEIFETLKKHNDQLSYEVINEMTYLNMVIYETLRKDPPGLVVIRKSVHPYKLPGRRAALPTGTIVFISPYCIHHDERYYSNPELFDPERFKDDNNHPIFLSFGEGSRNCIGSRFGTYQSALGIISILKHFKVSPSDSLQVPFQINKTAIVLRAAGGVNLKFEPLN